MIFFQFLQYLEMVPLNQPKGKILINHPKGAGLEVGVANEKIPAVHLTEEGPTLNFPMKVDQNGPRQQDLRASVPLTA